MYIQFKIDPDQLPVVLNLREDICLGRVANLDSLILKSAGRLTPEKNATWECETRNYTVTDDGFFKFKIRSFGIYAVIMNPNPDQPDKDAQTSECGWACQNHLMLQILVMALLVLFVIVIYAFC
jgi:hypothetical protein